jgi:FtsZ-interacting cell division protein ZipA
MDTTLITIFTIAIVLLCGIIYYLWADRKETKNTIQEQELDARFDSIYQNIETIEREIRQELNDRINQMYRNIDDNYMYVTNRMNEIENVMNSDNSDNQSCCVKKK